MTPTETLKALVCRYCQEKAEWPSGRSEDYDLCQTHWEAVCDISWWTLLGINEVFNYG